MTSPSPGPAYDPASVGAKYLAERDKRLVPGRADIRDLAADEHFARFTADPFTPYEERPPVHEELDVVIVGGGIAGVTAGAELRRAGIERIRIVDQAGGIGGTWYWNRYPGIMCDVESYTYLPMLEELGTIPTERYASGDEIRRHLVALAERFDLVDDALFHTGVQRASWDESAGRWRVETDRGDVLSARYYVLAVGILNRLKLPAIAGMERFAGPSFHTARWDDTVELAGKRVALVGTGATGIQILPPLARTAAAVTVFQRTPSAIGVRDNRPTDPEFAEGLAPGWQQARMDNFQAVMMGRHVDVDLVDDGWTHDYRAVQNPERWKGMTFEEFLRRAEEVDFEIMEAHRSRVAELVDDPATAEALKPYYRYLCKRPCFHDEYLGAYNQPNVRLVDCPAGIDEVTETGLVVDGRLHEVDVIIWGTGFEPELTPLPRRAGHHVVGRHGITLAERWADGSATLFGMMSHGFPNLFAMPAPGQQAVVTVNYTQLAVLGASFVGRTVAQLDARGAHAFDVSAEAQERWCEQIVASFVDVSGVMSACTPSRINNEGHPEALNPRNGNYGRGFGDYFAYRELLEGWLADGRLEGLELVDAPS